MTVYGYLDFRLYIQDFLIERARSPTFSFRGFSKKCGISSPGYIQTLLRKRQAKVSPRTAEKLIRGLNLNGSEADYFRDLVRLQHSQSKSMKQGRLSPLTAAESIEDFEIYRRWYFAVIWELVSCKGFAATPSNLSKALKGLITLAEAQEAIRFLTENQYLLQTEVPGVFAQSKPFLMARSASTDDEQRRILKQAHKKFMNLSEQMLNAPEEYATFRGLTIAVSDEKLKLARERVEALVNELQHLLANDPEANRVVRINLDIFEITNRIGEMK